MPVTVKPLELEAAINAYTRRVTIEVLANRNPDPTQPPEDLATVIKRSVLIGMRLGADVSAASLALLFQPTPERKPTDPRFWAPTAPIAPTAPTIPPLAAAGLEPASVPISAPAVPQERAETAPPPVVALAVAPQQAQEAQPLQVEADRLIPPQDSRGSTDGPGDPGDMNPTPGQPGHLTRAQRRALKEQRRAEAKAARLAARPAQAAPADPEIAP